MSEKMGGMSEERPIGRREFVEIGAAAGAAAAVFASTGCTSSSSEEDGEEGSAESEAQNEDEDAESGSASYTAGSYTASAAGKKSDVVVQVTFDDESITDIQFVEHYETGRIADAAMSSIGPAIIEYQSLDVDSVSGATLTSAAIKAAVKDCVEQAGGDVDALESASGPEKSDAVEELSADVVIVGAGATGLGAAVRIAQAGLSVVVMEKNGFIGGNMLVSDGRLHVPLESVPDDARSEMTDSLELYYSRSMDKASDLGYPDEILDAVTEAHDSWVNEGNTTVFDCPEWYGLSDYVQDGAEYDESFDWYIGTGYENKITCSKFFYEEAGAELETPIIGIAGYSWPRSSRVADTAVGEGLIDAFESFISDNDLNTIQFLLSTSASEILMEDGAAVGVSGQCSDGTTYNVSASVVLIASGGYGASKEWLERQLPDWGFDQLDSVPTVNPSWTTGDGIALAEAVGAQVSSYDTIMLIPYMHPDFCVLDHIIGDTTNPLVVNKEGLRFMNENDSRTNMALAVMEQTDQTVYLIASEQNATISDYGRNFAGEDAQHVIDYGMVYQADTLEELAEMIDIDYDTLNSTIEAYNAQCESGEIDEFGRIYFAETAPITDGPYYASPMTWATLCTYDGILVDDNCQVLDTSDEPISGLYAIGEVMGDPFLYSTGDGLVLGEAIAAALVGSTDEEVDEDSDGETA